MSELESVNVGARFFDGIVCNTEYSQLSEKFDLVQDAQAVVPQDARAVPVQETQNDQQPDVCYDGVCPTNWKPERTQAA
ncbi:MAG TPA: hypothetical protein V6C89_05050 [Drouetiella sp.]|jgi:hypothetical protein